jgi:Immune inhibitor A-like, MAM domain
MVLAAIVVAAAPALAFVVPEPTPISAKAMTRNDLQIPSDLRPALDVPASLQAQVALDLAALGVSPDNAMLDLRGARWGTLIPTEPLLPGTGTGNSLTWQDMSDRYSIERPRSYRDDPVAFQHAAWEAFVGYLNDYRSQLHVDPAELANPGRVAVSENGALVQIYAPRVVGGVPVRDSFLTAVINHGNLVLFGAVKWGDANVSTEASVTVDEAIQNLQTYLGSFTIDGFWTKSYPVLLPTSAGAQFTPGQGYGYRLAWAIHPKIAGEMGHWEALVDAHSGDMLSFQDTNDYATTRQVKGGVYPISNDGSGPEGMEQAGYPMPFADVINGATTRYSDAGGNLNACVDGTITTHLSGTYVQITDLCGAINESTTGAVLDLGTSSGTDCTVPSSHSAGDTHAARTGFFELNQIKDMARGWLPDNTWLQGQLNSNMNLNQTCNAYWDGVSVNFFRSGGGCFNTGELAGVFDHEWGHGMDNNGVNPNIANPGEGVPDIYAALRIDHSCLGRGFQGSLCGGYGDPCSAASGCTGVRDIDFAHHNSGLPFTITRLQTLCPGGSDPCGKEVHCAGQVYAQAVWDLFNRDLTGGVLNYDADRSHEIATRDTYLGASPVGTWYQCVQGSGGCPADSGYQNYLAADDDNGNLTDGTPHMTALFAAFDRHGVACSTPTVQNSGCGGGPTTAPTVTPTAVDRGASLSWTAVAGASKYQIFRTDGVFGCNYGKVKVGETTGTSFIDDGLQNGRTYYYTVAAIGSADTCIGPMSSCTSVTPVAGANLAIDESATSVVINTGDTDPFLDNCETATVTVEAVNIGTTTLHNVRITSVTSPSHPGTQLLTTLPVPIADPLGACSTETGNFQIKAQGLSYNDTLVLDVAITADELGGDTRTTTINVPHTESDLQHFATRTFSFETDSEGWQVTSGTFARAGGGGGNGTTFALHSSSAIDNECDKVRSPVMRLAADSTLSLYNNYTIEPMSSSTWYDRANVGVVTTAGARTAVSPDSGRLYNAVSGGPGSYSGCNNPEPGWAGTNATWGTSSWSATALHSSTFAGQLVNLEVIYATDSGLSLAGFAFDELTVTDVDFQVPDTHSNVCGEVIFADGFESGNTSAWSLTVP